MTHGALFNGIAGFPLAAAWAGVETTWTCEIDEFCNKVSKKHFPNAIQYTDIRHCKDLPSVDIISGGFPCKQTSLGAAIHGKRAGLEGPDSGLWHEQIRILREVRPAWAIVENPSAVKKWESKIQGGLEALGYTVSRVECQANHFGLPHQRRRYLYVGNTHGQRLEITRVPESPTIEWIERLTSSGGTWLSGTPGAVGSFNGLPNRVDRVRALGNAVVPQKAWEVFKAIKEIESARQSSNLAA